MKLDDANRQTMKFTLDNNCLIAVAKNEPAARQIRILAQAHMDARAEVSVLGISASERQSGGGYLSDINDFRLMLDSVGLGHLAIYKPTGICDVTFWDWSVWSTDESMALEQRIHDILFPPWQYHWQSAAAKAGEALDSTTGPAYRKWRNRRCDVQGMLAHIMNGGDVFVTTDTHFLKKRVALMSLGAGEVLEPSEAAAHL